MRSRSKRHESPAGRESPTEHGPSAERPRLTATRDGFGRERPRVEAWNGLGQMARPAAPCDRETIRLSGGDDRAPGSRRVLTEERDGDGAASSPERRYRRRSFRERRSSRSRPSRRYGRRADSSGSGPSRSRCSSSRRGCWLGAIVVAHVAAGVAARVAHRSGTSR